MADIKISALPTASIVNDADILVLNQGGNTKTATKSLVVAGLATTGQLSGFATTAQLSAFQNSAQVQALASAQISAITPASIGAVATSAIIGISNGGTGATTAVVALSNLGGITSAALAGYATTAQVGGLNSAQVNALAADQILALGLGQDWSPTKEYKNGDVVSVTSQVYVAKSASGNINQNPMFSPNYWFLADTNAATIVGQPVDWTAPSIGNVLAYNGSVWISSEQQSSLSSSQVEAIASAQIAAITPASIGAFATDAIIGIDHGGTGAITANDALTNLGAMPVTQSAGGDLSGSLTSPNVVGLQGYPISSSGPFGGAILAYNGSAWEPTFPPPQAVTSVTVGQELAVDNIAGGTITSSGTITISNTGVTAGVYGSSTQVAVLDVNIIGQITSAHNVAISPAGIGAVSTDDIIAISKGGTGSTDAVSALSALGAAGLTSPAFTGTPTAPTASAGTNTTQLATTAFVQSNKGDSYLTTSTSPQTIGNGTKTFTVEAGLSYTPTQDCTMVYDASNHMHGTVVTYSGTTLVVDVTQHTGAGSYSLWTINVGGLTTAAGALLSANNLSDVANTATALTNIGGVPTSRTVSAGTGLTGGGDLTANRTLSLATTAVTPGSYGSATQVAALTVDAYGRLTSATSSAITPSGIGAQTALTSASPLAIDLGGTGQISYSNGQLLIGNSTGNTLTKATLTGTGNVTVTNGAGSIAIGTSPSLQYEFFEHFLSSSTPFLGNMAASNSGGTLGSNGSYTSKIGVINFSTGAAAVADQRAAINNAPTAISIGGSNIAYEYATSFTRNSAAWLGGATTGFLRFGFLSIVAQTGIAEPISGVYFRATNSDAIEFVTRNGNVETVTATGVSLVTNTFNKYEISINSAATQVIAKIDGVVVATHTTNIPVAANRLGIITTLQRVSTDATSLIISVDWIYFKATPVTPFF